MSDTTRGQARVPDTRPSSQPAIPPPKASAALKVLGWTASIIIVLGVALYIWFSSESAPDLAWMGWTKPTAIFFCSIVVFLIAMSVWEAFSPGGGPRIGILQFETTRGDRLFLTLLGSAFICLAWLGLVDAELWKALGVCAIYAALVFTFV